MNADEDYKKEKKAKKDTKSLIRSKLIMIEYSPLLLSFHILNNNKSSIGNEVSNIGYIL